jgi:hypothetical protein
MCHPSSKTTGHGNRVELRGARACLPLTARDENSAVLYLPLLTLLRPLYGPLRPLPSVAVLTEMVRHWCLQSVRLHLSSLPD